MTAYIHSHSRRGTTITELVVACGLLSSLMLLVVPSAIRIGRVQQATGDAAAAEASYQEALEVFLVRLGEDHPTVARTRTSLASLKYGLGAYAEAEILARAALVQFEKTLPADSPWIASARRLLDASLEKQGKAAGAGDR